MSLSLPPKPLQHLPRLASLASLANFVALCTLSFSPVAQAVDIYYMIDADGVPHYASSAIDSRYQIFLRGETPPAPPPVTQDKFATTRAAFLATWLPTLRELSQQHQVELALILAVIEVESRYNSQANSPKGAVGLMQLMPSVAARYGVRDRYDALQNVEAGVKYLRDLQKQHKDNLALVLASYNAGSGAVARHGRRIPPYKETLLYVPQVLAQLANFRAQAHINCHC